MPVNTWKLSVSLFLILLFSYSCTNKNQLVRSSGGFSFYGDGETYVSSETFYSSKAYLKEKQGSQAMHRATLRPYSTFGIKYYPKVEPIGWKQRGIASWYGPDFHGKATSSGEIYDMHEMTAAHKTLPMNTIVNVRHLKTGKEVRVRISDRGPFVQGRIIDLSFAAGKILGLDKTGTAPVELEVIKYDEVISKNYDVSGARDLGADPSRAEPRSNEPSSAVASSGDPSAGGGVGLVAPGVIAVGSAGAGAGKDPSKSSLAGAGAGSYGVQVGAFSNEKSAVDLMRDLLGKYGKPARIVKTAKGGAVINKVVIEGFATKDAAQDFINKNQIAGRAVLME